MITYETITDGKGYVVLKTFFRELQKQKEQQKIRKRVGERERRREGKGERGR